MRVVFPMCLGGLMHLLHNCPSLEVLVLKRGYSTLYRMNNRSQVNCLPICLPTKIKRVEIWNLLGSRSELELICSILKGTKALETLLVATRVESGTVKLYDGLDFSRELCELQRSSPTCQICFLGDCLDTSSKGNGILA